MNRDAYIQETYCCEDEVLQAIRADIAARKMPPISVRPELGRLLTLLVAVSGATRVLEIGVLGGYRGVCLARGLPQGGRMTSLELSSTYAEVARANLARAGLADRVEYRVGPAVATLAELVKAQERFDFIFIDADKVNYPAYLDAALQLAMPGTLLCADNALLHDAVFDSQVHTPEATAMRAFNHRLAHEPGVVSVLLPVHDGFAVARIGGGESESVHA
ncbi:MAG: O-methyltransferase [Firmicutes bacterium]|nr:O-methyltransferase [Bacillota bacterium]